MVKEFGITIRVDLKEDLSSIQESIKAIGENFDVLTHSMEVDETKHFPGGVELMRVS